MTSKFSSATSVARASLILLIVGLCAGLGSPVHGQQDAGTIKVIVMDASDAVIPGAEVTVENTATSATQTKITGDQGTVIFSPLQRGIYTVEVGLQGFQTVLMRNVGLDVNQSRLLRVNLQVAEIAEVIEVQAEAAQLQSEEASLGQTVKGDVIEELPLAARRYTDLTLLGPGATESTLNEDIRGPGWLVVNGNFHTQNNFVLDGFDNNQNTTNLQSRSAQVVQPSPDALSEFKVMTNNFSAEFGRAAGAVINASIKSGTNELHGSAWYYNRPTDLAANSWTSNLIGAGKDDLSWDQVGFTIGGPILQDKLFYFGDYEGFFSQTSTLAISTLPTPAFVNGDFSQLAFELVDPSTGEPFPNNQIPQDRFDPLGKKIMDLYPSPNLDGIVTLAGRVADNFGAQLPDETDTHKFDVRIDYIASFTDRIFGRYSFNESDRFLAPLLPAPADTGGETGGSQFARNQSLGIAWNRTISSNMINEVRFGYDRTASNFAHATLGGTTGSEFGFKGIPPELDEVGGLPRLTISEYQNLGTGPWRPQFQNPDAYEIQDTLSYIRGAHSMKMGFSFRHKNNEWVDLQFRTMQFDFQGRFTGDAAADLLLGLPQQIRGQTFMVAEQIQQNYSAFFQDDWKVSPELTLNLGLRYEYATPFWGRSPNPNINVDLQTGQLIASSFATDDQLVFGARRVDNKYTHDRDLNNFGPRFGISYQLTPDFVLRGGYGVFYNGEDFHGSGGNLILNPPNTFPVTLQREGDGPPPMILSEPVPDNFLDTSAFRTSDLGFRARVQDYDASTVQQWNVALEMLLPYDSTLEFAYVGNKGTNLDEFYNANQTPFGVDGSIPENRFYPELGSLSGLESKGGTRYNALQVKYEKRFTASTYQLVSYSYQAGLANAGGFAARAGVQEVVVRDGRPTALRENEWGFHDQLTRQRFSWTNIWQLPFGRNKRFGTDWNRALDLFLGGWQLQSITTIKSGLPVNVTLSAAGINPLTGQPYAFFPGSTDDLRPDRVGKPNTDIDPTDDRTKFLDQNAFRLQEINTPGDSARNVAWGPGFFNVDLGITKRFPVTEDAYFDFRFEMFNTFNHTNFKNPNGRWDSASFGVINDAFGPRQMQIAVRFSF